MPSSAANPFSTLRYQERSSSAPGPNTNRVACSHRLNSISPTCQPAPARVNSIRSWLGSDGRNQVTAPGRPASSASNSVPTHMCHRSASACPTGLYVSGSGPIPGLTPAPGPTTTRLPRARTVRSTECASK